MANFADCAVVRNGDGFVIVAVTSASKDDVGGGSWWTLHDENGALFRHGITKGWSGDGWGSALTSMKAGKAAARRFLARKAKLAKNRADEERER